MERTETTYDWRSAGLKPWTPGRKNGGYSPTDAALHLAIAHVWLSEGLYAPECLQAGTAAFERFSDYVLGYQDGIPKRPQWAAPISGVPSYAIKALARQWGDQAVPLADEDDLAELVSKAGRLGAELAPRPPARHTGLPPTLIGGTVYDYEADEVIEGALVTIRPAGGAPGPEGTTGASPTVTTDECGRFLVDRPEGGPYVVFIKKEGYVPVEVGPFAAGDGPSLRDFAMFVDAAGLKW